jgi:hypothetical protein
MVLDPPEQVTEDAVLVARAARTPSHGLGEEFPIWADTENSCDAQDLALPGQGPESAPVAAAPLLVAASLLSHGLAELPPTLPGPATAASPRMEATPPGSHGLLGPGPSSTTSPWSHGLPGSLHNKTLPRAMGPHKTFTSSDSAYAWSWGMVDRFIGSLLIVRPGSYILSLAGWSRPSWSLPRDRMRSRAWLS